MSRRALRWHLERWRARRAAWRADVELRRSFSPRGQARREAAQRHLRQVELNRP